MLKFLEKARQYAVAHEYDPGIDYRLCALIVQGGKILSVGYNRKGSNSFVERYADLQRGLRDYCLSVHAELDAILRARSKIDLRGTKMYVVRVKAYGEFGMARPCEICEQVFKDYGIKRVYYSIQDNEYGVMNRQENERQWLVS